ncbi:MAG TPA: hypothetical protein VGG53_04665 [Mycobacterium sp.]|jgi:hypothetical protein|uniref:hypothetical protein n=1 Tax=Mycobacterium sp. TaxID=1785 RepID=UPI002F42A8B4
MPPLVVDPEMLDGAGAAVLSIGEGLGSTVSTLTTALAGCHGMAGDDPAGAAFGRSYNTSASKLLEALATTRNGLCRLGDGVRMSAHNYSVAEAMSNISGHGQPLPGPHLTGLISAGSTPSAVGHGIGAPAGWGWVSKYIGMIWPTGDSAKLRSAAAAWINAGTNFEVSEITGAVGPMSGIGAQQIPEGPAIGAAFTETNRCAAAILHQSVTVATQLTSYATKIDTVHAAIMDLLSRICNPLTGIKEVWEFLTDEDEDEISKIANDIRIIINQFTAEVDALRQDIVAAFAEATTVVSTMARYAEKEWDHFLHASDIGRALDHVGQICEGAFTEAADLVEGLWPVQVLRAVIDPDGFWHSVSDTVEKVKSLTGLEGEQKFEDSWKELGKDTVHWDEWATNPFKAAGESTFDLATLLLPGGALSKVSKLGSLAADAAEAPKSVHLPTPGRVPNPAPHDKPPPQNEPTRGGQPEAAPKPKNALPPYGLTESKSPTGQKPPADTAPKPVVESAPPSHEPDRHGTSAPALTERSIGPRPAAPTTSAVMSPGFAGTPPAHPPPSPSSSHGHGSSDGHGGSGDDTALHGLTEDKRDEILALPKGSRPDPYDYLSPEYIEQHLDKFHEGATRFMPESNLDKYGIAQRDGTSFIMPKSEADALIEAIRGDPRAMEKALGLIEGFLDSNKIVRIDIGHPHEFDLRMPSGNELGANDQWIPGGKLPDGASEAVIDAGNVPRPDYSVTDVSE